MSAKYAVGDIIQLNNQPSIQRKIMHVFTALYDEEGFIYYQTILVGDASFCPLTSLSEKTINKYYTIYNRENQN
jgi:hypothetical protein